MKLFNLTLLIADKFFAGGKIDARVGTKASLSLFLTVVQFINFGPFGPRIVRLPGVRRARQNFNLRETLALVSHGGADTVRASVPTADDNHILIGR